MAQPSQFAFRAAKAVGVVDAYPAYTSLHHVASVNCRTAQYSPCGRWWAWATPTTVTVIDTVSAATVMTLDLFNVFELEFSPRGSYLSTLERQSKDEAGDASKNLKVWKVQATLDQAAGPPEPVGQFVQKQNEGWNLDYTADEKYCARMVTNEVQFYQSADLKTVWNKLHIDGVRGFALGRQNQVVAVYIPVKAVSLRRCHAAACTYSDHAEPSDC
jgi:translation initiation factor 2A